MRPTPLALFVSPVGSKPWKTGNLRRNTLFSDWKTLTFSPLFMAASMDSLSGVKYIIVIMLSLFRFVVSIFDTQMNICDDEQQPDSNATKIEDDPTVLDTARHTSHNKGDGS